MLLASIIAVVVTGAFRRLPPELRHHLYPPGALEAVASKCMGRRQKVSRRVFALFLPVSFLPQVVLVFLPDTIEILVGLVLEETQGITRLDPGRIVFSSPGILRVFAESVPPSHTREIMHRELPAMLPDLIRPLHQFPC